jgi:hypothetical protein
MAFLQPSSHCAQACRHRVSFGAGGRCRRTLNSIAIIYREGDRLVIEPVRKRGLIALLKTTKPLKKGLPEIDDPVPTPNNSLG